MTKDQIQAKALEAIGDLKKAGVEISMGVGKCLLGWKHMNQYYTDSMRCLIVAPRTTIFTSWKDDAQKFGFDFLLPHVDFTTYMSLTIRNSKAYDIVYLDECHSLKETHNQWLKDFEMNGGRIIGLTGTYPIRGNTEKGRMCTRYCPKVYHYKTDDAVNDEILNDYRIYVHKLYLSGAPTMEVKRRDGGTFMTSEWKNYSYWNERIEEAQNPNTEQIARIQRMKALQKMPGKLEYAKTLFMRQTEKTLVFANTKEQADYLCPNRVYSGMDKGVAEQNLIDFKTGTITKLSAVDQLSEGVTIPNLRVGIIMHAYANNRKASQKIGRFLRLNPIEVSTVHILCYVNSIDKEWTLSALQSFDQAKIKWIDAQ